MLKKRNYDTLGKQCNFKRKSKSFWHQSIFNDGSLEALQIMNSTDDNVGLLVDVAHLKVASYSEGFVKINTLIQLKNILSHITLVIMKASLIRMK